MSPNHRWFPFYQLSPTGGSLQNEAGWTKLIRELHNCSIGSPQVFISTLMLYCELLPQPLPLIVEGEGEKSLVLHYRTTWAAHLEPIWGEMKVHFSSLLDSNNTNLNQVRKQYLPVRPDKPNWNVWFGLVLVGQRVQHTMVVTCLEGAVTPLQ